jgi:ribosomal protein S18 acetylase RimI-like enzyme
MIIRKATLLDLSAVTAIEAACFPAAEAATEHDFRARLQVYPNHFWLLEDNHSLVGFINGMVTNEPVIHDEMYVNAHLHNESGNWQAIFGVNTLPECRCRGYAAKMMQQVIEDAKAEARKGCILNCKEVLVHYYEKFGFTNMGRSKSTHGGAVWYDMQLIY